MAAVRYHYGQFPPLDLDWARLVPGIGPAMLALGDFKGLLDAIPNADVLLSPLRSQEAVLSSRIEGTRATLGEVLEYDAGNRDHPPDLLNEIREVSNYRRAIQHAASRLSDLPLCGRLLKEAHEILMRDVRGGDKNPGQYKRLANAIGPPGCDESSAKFLPMTPDKLEDGMSRWESYIHSKQPDVLVQLGLVHVEFEALHPFADGNGRLGRMILPLFLYEKGVLRYPAFYLSGYLEAHRDEYYERLLAVSRDGDWTGWSLFFLRAVEVQARENTRKARAILQLYEERKRWIREETRSQYAIPALDFIFNQPIFRSEQFAKQPEIPDRTARKLLNRIRESILVELRPSSGRSSAVLAYPELLNIAEGKDAF